jgi:hypothetical protein
VADKVATNAATRESLMVELREVHSDLEMASAEAEMAMAKRADLERQWAETEMAMAKRADLERQWAETEMAMEKYKHAIDLLLLLRDELVESLAALGQRQAQ